MGPTSWTSSPIAAVARAAETAVTSLLSEVIAIHCTTVAAHMQALWRYRRRIRRSRLGRRRYFGLVPGRRPNKHRDFRSGLRAILRDYFGLDGSPPVYDERTLRDGSGCPGQCFCVSTTP